MSKTVNLAGTEYPVEGMTPFKFELVGDKLVELLKKVPDVDKRWEAKVKAFREENKEIVDRSTAQMRYGGPLRDDDGNVVLNPMTGEVIPGRLAHLTEADWEKADPPQTVTARPNPGDMAEVSFYFEEYYEHAKKDVLEILAVLLILNRDLENADMGETGAKPIPDLIEEKFRMLRYRAPIDECMNLVVTAGSIITETIEARKGELGNLIRSLRPKRAEAEDKQKAGQENESPKIPTELDEQTPAPQSGQPLTPALTPMPPSSIPTPPSQQPEPREQPPTPSARETPIQESESERESSIASHRSTDGATEKRGIAMSGASSPNSIES